MINLSNFYYSDTVGEEEVDFKASINLYCGKLVVSDKIKLSDNDEQLTQFSSTLLACLALITLKFHAIAIMFIHTIELALTLCNSVCLLKCLCTGCCVCI